MDSGDCGHHHDHHDDTDDDDADDIDIPATSRTEQMTKCRDVTVGYVTKPECDEVRGKSL